MLIVELVKLHRYAYINLFDEYYVAGAVKFTIFPHTAFTINDDI